MARRRSKTSATGGNMDSLLDALTNVVGILVIVLVAVQISSQEAAKRMEEMIAKIDPEELKIEFGDVWQRQPGEAWSIARRPASVQRWCRSAGG